MELKNFETGSSGNQEFANSDMRSSGNQEFANSEMGLSGNQVFGVTKEVQKQNVFEDGNNGLATCCITFDENLSETLCENKVEECLTKSTVELSADGRTNVSNFPDFQRKREFIVEEFDNSSWISDRKLGTREIGTDGKGIVCEIMQKMEKTTNCAMMIKVIDETAVIETRRLCQSGNGIGKERGVVASAKHAEGNVHKGVMKQERDGKEGKRSRRRGKGARKLQGTDGTGNFLNHKAEIQNDFRKKGEETKRTYSRTEMQALRFVDFKAQQKKWAEIYCGLAPNVARGYDGLIDCNIQKHIQINFDPRQQIGKKKKNIPGVFGMVAAKGRGNHLTISVQ